MLAEKKMNNITADLTQAFIYMKDGRKMHGYLINRHDPFHENVSFIQSHYENMKLSEKNIERIPLCNIRSIDISLT